jgi:hypothetical protein
LTITDLFDLANEDLSLLSTVLADLRSQTQLGLRLQSPPDEVLSDGIKVRLVASDVLLLFFTKVYSSSTSTRSKWSSCNRYSRVESRKVIPVAP